MILGRARCGVGAGLIVAALDLSLLLSRKFGGESPTPILEIRNSN